MTSESIDEILSKLQDKVNTITSKNGSNNISDNSSINLIKSKSHLLVYAAIPIIIIVVLCVLKPGFIMYLSDNNYYISYKKVLIVTLIFCCILGGGIIAWNQYKR